MVDVSIVVPVGPYHEAIVDKAIASCHAQTAPVTVVVVQDRNGYGAGWARNRGLEVVTTEFVVFLDADDWLAPTFVERTRQVWQPGRYVYCDWWEGETFKFAPPCPFVNRSWHVITTLLQTEDVCSRGGFDEGLTGGEDTDLYCKLNSSGVCGLYLPEPLFHYSAHGKRGAEFVNSPQFQAVMREFTRRYGGKMGCCGDNDPTPDVPANDPLPGDVLARAIWNGNRVEIGRVTRRHYPRTGNGKQLYADPRDIAAAPHLLQRVIENPLPVAYPNIPAQARVQYLEPAPPDAFPTRLTDYPLDGAVEVGAAFNDFQRARWPQLPPTAPQTVTPAEVAPDVAKAVALYRQARGEHQ